MTARLRPWLRRHLAAWAWPEIERLDGQVADEQDNSRRLAGQLAEARADAAGTDELMQAWRGRALAAERDLTAARRRPVDEAPAERAARLKVVEAEGGR